MKKILLGTTALVAAAGFAGIASAQQVTTKATTLGISGSIEFEGAYADNDGTSADRKIDFLSDGDFTFSPKYVADNGLTTTGRIDFGWDNTNNSTMATDEMSITFASASFGSLTLGDDDGAVDNFYQQGPLVGDGNWDGSATRFVTTGWAGDNIEQNLNGDATKVYYSTSGLAALDSTGLTFGASYTPKSDSQFDNGNLTKSAGNASDIYDIGGTWEGEFSGFSITLGGDYISGKVDLAGRTASSWNAGGTVGFGSLKVGGGYTSISDVAADGADDDVWAVGATYALGAFNVGATYTKSSYDVASGSDDSSAYGFAVDYAVAPGVTALGEVNQFKDDDSGEDATVVMLGTKVAF